MESISLLHPYNLFDWEQSDNSCFIWKLKLDFKFEIFGQKKTKIIFVFSLMKSISWNVKIKLNIELVSVPDVFSVSVVPYCLF